MQTARRLYVYLMSGIALGALVTGLMLLVGVLLDRAGLGPAGDVVFGGDEAIRERLTVATALVAVALPVWLVHWFLAERSVHPDRPDASRELNATERGLFFALVLGALLLVGAFGLASAIDGALLRIFGADAGFRDIAGDLGRGTVAFVAWGYHVRVRNRDWGRATLARSAAWLPRAYRYLAAFVGLVVALSAITGLIDLVGRVLTEPAEPVIGREGPWWAYPLAEGIAGLVVGAAVWIGHWLHATRLLDRAGTRGASERASRLRLAAYVAIGVVAATGAIVWVGIGIGAAAELLLGTSDADDVGQAVAAVLVPLASAVPFAIVAVVHARWLDGEPFARETDGGEATVDRLRIYPIALVGLAIGAVGTAWIVRVLVEAIAGDPGIGGGELLRRQLAQFAPLAVLGWAAWIWRWAAANRRSAADPGGEAASTTRRGVVLLALGGAVLASIGAAGTILYRVFGSLFGVTLIGDTVSALSLPLGILVVAAGVATWHAAVLRGDARHRDAGDAEPMGTAGDDASVTTSVRLRLIGRASGVDDALAALRRASPPGYTLERETEEMP